MIDVRVISIGALSAHPLWGERSPVRTGHATTTLVRSGDVTLLVDPGLPFEALQARLAERAGIAANDVTHVFLTSFTPDVWRGIEGFENAEWLIHEPEREQIGAALIGEVKRASDAGDDEVASALARDVAILKRCVAAPDSLAPQVDLFPLPGVTPGSCGVIIGDVRTTTVICGDAVPTLEHLEEGKVLPRCADIEAAKASLMEAVEIADVLVLGRDNLVVNPTRGPF